LRFAAGGSELVQGGWCAENTPREKNYQNLNLVTAALLSATIGLARIFVSISISRASEGRQEASGQEA
jgi:hypothetical protein